MHQALPLAPAWRRVRSLRHSHQLKHVTVWVLEVNASAAIPVIELAVIETPRSAPICESSLFDAVEDRVELGVVYVEGVVVAIKRGVLVEQERQRLVYPNWREVALSSLSSSPKISAKKRAAANLSRAGTMVWFRMIVIKSSLLT